jgi:peptidoglycan/xylan/chitin deacetylase (PgdA/CDA1 family)
MNKKKLLLIFMCFFSFNFAFAQSAVILMYHRVGEDTVPSTNVTVAQFTEEMDYLSEAGYQVLPLRTIIQTLKQGKPLPPKTVAITFDDGYRSIYTTAFPILKAHGFPFTVFLATGPIDYRYTQMMNWDEVIALSKAGGTIENHTVSHSHLAFATKDFINKEVQKANDEIYAHTKVMPILFAYPFGEYSHATASIIEDMGFEAAFTQVSGIASSEDNLFEIPRLPLNEEFANFDRFKAFLMYQPLVFSTVSPNDIAVYEALHTVQIRLKYPQKIGVLNCFDSGGKSIRVISDEAEYTLMLNHPLKKGRNRFNCTSFDKAQNTFLWAGLLYILS